MNPSFPAYAKRGKKGAGRENCIEFLKYFYILSPRAHYHARLSKSGECSLVNSRRRVTLITKSPFLFPFPQVGEKGDDDHHLPILSFLGEK